MTEFDLEIKGLPPQLVNKHKLRLEITPYGFVLWGSKTKTGMDQYFIDARGISQDGIIKLDTLEGVSGSSVSPSHILQNDRSSYNGHTIYKIISKSEEDGDDEDD